MSTTTDSINSIPAPTAPALVEPEPDATSQDKHNTIDRQHRHERTKSGNAKPPSLDQLIAKRVFLNEIQMKPDSQTSSATETPPRFSAPSAPGSRLRLPPSALSRGSGTQSQGPPSANSSEPSPNPPHAALPPQPAGPGNPSPSVALHPPPEDESRSEPQAVAPEHLQQLPSQPRPSRGYKNVPSLEAISSRLAALRERTDSRSRSRDDEDRQIRPADVQAPYAMGALEDALDETLPEEGEGEEEEEEEVEEGEIEDEDDQQATDTDAAPAMGHGQEHPLQHAWTWYYDNKAPRPTPVDGGDVQQTPTTNAHHLEVSPVNEYEAGLSVIGEFNTVEAFSRYWNWCKPPSKLERGSNYHFFKKGIKPLWEDAANANGGKWALTMRNNPALLDQCWTELLMALIGEALDPYDEVTGCVVSLRSRIDRIQLWTRGRDDVERVNALGRRMAGLLGLEKHLGLMFEFQYHTDEWPHPGKFLSINTTITHSHPFPHHAPPGAPPAAPNGVMGAFGAGSGPGTTAAAAGAGWRGAAAAQGGPAPVRSNLFGTGRPE